MNFARRLQIEVDGRVNVTQEILLAKLKQESVEAVFMTKDGSWILGQLS